MIRFTQHTLSALTLAVVFTMPVAIAEKSDQVLAKETGVTEKVQQSAGVKATEVTKKVKLVVDAKATGVGDKPGQDDNVKELIGLASTAAEEALPPQSKKALAKLKKYMDSTKSLTADFSSILLDDSGQQTDASNGTVAFKVPGKFRWQYVNPDPSILLADGVDLWHFDEVLEQVIVSSLDDYRGANPSLLLGGDSDKITEGFKVVGSHKTEGDQWIVLETRDRNSDFVTVRIKFSDDAIELMELVDRVDQTSRISFSDVTLNADIDDELFTFEVPEGASLNGQPSKR